MLVKDAILTQISPLISMCLRIYNVNQTEAV